MLAMRISGARSHHLQTVECNKAAAAPAGGHHPRPRALFTPTTRLWDAGIRVPLAARFFYIQMPMVTGALGTSPAAGLATSGTSGSRILPGASSPLPGPMGSYLSTSEPVAPVGPAQSAGCGVKPGALHRCRGTGAPPRKVTPRLWKRFPAKPPLEAVLVPRIMT